MRRLQMSQGRAELISPRRLHCFVRGHGRLLKCLSRPKGSNSFIGFYKVLHVRLDIKGDAKEIFESAIVNYALGSREHYGYLMGKGRLDRIKAVFDYTIYSRVNQVVHMCNLVIKWFPFIFLLFGQLYNKSVTLGRFT
jgi:hypothetical protein